MKVHRVGRRLRCVAAVALVGVVACGCASEPTPSGPPHAYGDAIAPGPKPDPAACLARIRADERSAARIRADLRVDGVSAEPLAVKTAAADPAADISSFGIPLTGPEMAAVRTFGIATDADTPIAMWVTAGAPDRFGGMWRRGGTTFVSVVNGDSDTLTLAQCVAPADTRYVWATVSKAEGEAITEKVGADMQGWKTRGVQINTADYDETTGVVNVGVSVVNEPLLAELQSRYGPLIRLVQAGPIVPA